MPTPGAACAPDRFTPARAVAATWIAGATLLLLMAFVLRRDPAAHQALFAGVAGAAYAGAVALLVARTVSRRALEGFTVLGSVLVALTVVASHDATGPYAFFYVWITVQAFAVVPLRRVGLQLATVGATYVAATALTPAHDERGVAFAMVLGTIAATSLFAGLARRHAERTAATVTEAERRDPNRDHLTGLLNADTLNTAFALEIARASRGRHALSLLAFDIDGFAAIEERYGPDVHDTILVEAARALESSCRLTDVAVRTGDATFAVLLPETDRGGARIAAERLRALLADVELIGEAGDEEAPGRLTASIGIATYRDHGISAEDMTCAAEDALGTARKLGGDRVAIAATVVAH